MYRVLSLCAAAAAAALLASPAAAGTVMFQGLGMFDKSAPSNAYVTPGDSFTFAFELDSPVANPAAASVDDFVYTIENVVQKVTLKSVDFNTGGFNLVFADKSQLEFIGADLGSNGRLLEPTMGMYSVLFLAPPPKIVPSFRSFALAAPPKVGMATVVTTGPQIPASVPEPAAWALMIGGFGLTGAALRRQRRLALGCQPASAGCSGWRWWDLRSATTTPEVAASRSSGAWRIWSRPPFLAW